MKEKGRGCVVCGSSCGGSSYKLTKDESPGRYSFSKAGDAKSWRTIQN